ncbi:ATP binding, partial [Rhizoctonia solani]
MAAKGIPNLFCHPWEGDTKLVLGIDVGTTYSSVAFAFLRHGEGLVLHRVIGWPGQEATLSSSKIPTIIWYDTEKRAVNFGAEALLPYVEEEAEENDWILAKHFKLHLHPADMQSTYNRQLDSRTRLPHGVTLGRLYSDFLGYLLKHTRAHFESHIIDGRHIWERYSSTMEVVITHPNGWGIREQVFLRSAAVAAGLSISAQAATKVRLVTEAEALVNFCIYHTNLRNDLQMGMNFIACNAGDSLIETNLYSVLSTLPTLKLEEKRDSLSVQAGSKFVDLEMEKFLRNALTNIGLSSDEIEDYTKAGTEDFKRNAKRMFGQENDQYIIDMADIHFNNTALGIRRGRMRLAGSTIKSFFKECLDKMTESVDQQLNGVDVSYILLIGELGDSPYIRRQFKERYEPLGLQIVTPDDSASNRIADGAIIWSISQGTSTRASRFSWGMDKSVAFEQNNPEHKDREPTLLDSGWTVIPGKWHSFIKKGVLPSVGTAIRIPYCLDFSSPVGLGHFKLNIYSYSGNDEPTWMRDKQGDLLPKFCHAATIEADLETLRETLQCQMGLNGVLQWQLNFDVCLYFEEAAVAGYLEWKEKQVVRTSPHTYIPFYEDQEIIF